MKTIIVKEKEIKKSIRKALNDVENRWNGWGIDITISPENGAVLSSDYNNGNVVYGNCKKFCRVITEDVKQTKKQKDEETEWIYRNGLGSFQETIGFLKANKDINLVIE